MRATRKSGTTWIWWRWLRAHSSLLLLLLLFSCSCLPKSARLVNCLFFSVALPQCAPFANLDTIRHLRIYLDQPSPNWKNFYLQHITSYEVDDRKGVAVLFPPSP